MIEKIVDYGDNIVEIDIGEKTALTIYPFQFVSDECQLKIGERGEV